MICKDISKATGMDPHDIAATLQILNMVIRKDNKYVLFHFQML